jgi:hypothetical protein
MECFNSRIKDLTEVLHISASLVSKWRNNKRLLKADSVYADLICEYYMKIDEKNSYQKIKALLTDQSISTNFENLTSHQLYILLKKWLTNEFISEGTSNSTLDCNSYRAQISIYYYDSGREKAVVRILEYLKSLPPNQIFLIYDFEEDSWKKSKTNFQERRRLLLTEILKNHQLHIIHTFNAKHDTLINIFERDIELNLNHRVKTFYLPPYQVPTNFSDILIIKNKAALICQYNEALPIQRYAEYHTDIRTVNYYQQLYETLENKSLPIYTHLYFENIHELEDYIRQKLMSKETVYFFSPHPFSFISNTITNNNDQAKTSMNRDERSFNLRLIYDLHKTEYLISMLCKSITTHKSSSVTLKVICDEIFQIINLLETNSCFEVTLLGKIPKIVAKNVVFVVENNQYAFASSFNYLDKDYYGLYVEDPTAVFVLYQYFEKLWTKIPLIQKDKKWVISKFKSLLERSEPYL